MHLKPIAGRLIHFESVPIDSDAEEAAEFLVIAIANQSFGIAAEGVWLAAWVMRIIHVTEADDAMGTCTEMVRMSDIYNLAEESVTAGKCRTWTQWAVGETVIVMK